MCSSTKHKKDDGDIKSLSNAIHFQVASGISQGIFQEITGTEKRLSGQTCSPFLLQALIGYGQDSPAYACISRPIAAANNGLAAAVDVKAPLNTASLSEYGSGKLCLPNTVMYAGPSTNSTL